MLDRTAPPAATAFPQSSPKEVARRYGIPDDAKRVLVFSESSHWDPDWLMTSKGYYRWRVRTILSKALAAVARDARRVYTIENVFFLKMFWDDQPKKREAIRAAFARGAWRLSGFGVTTPDTLVMHTEALVRDFTIGRAWLEEVGIGPLPKIAYLPDNFGNTPALPSLLRSVGVEATAFARLDGAHFVGTDPRAEGEFPLPGSSAWTLMREERSCDFVWRDEAGAEVLARFCPYSYGQGDMLGYRGTQGVMRWMSLPLMTVPDRRRDFVRRQVDGFAAQLEPLSRTRYLYCPIGHDFVDPMRFLMGVLDGYNDRYYRETGTWCVLASLEDYLCLVGGEREALPTLDFKPAPHWTGFYSARPMLKRRYRAAVEGLCLAEGHAAAARLRGAPDEAAEARLGALAPHWYWIAVGNHHDFVTGTGPERVYQKEQKPAIDAALAAANGALPDEAAEPIEGTRFEREGEGWTARRGEAALRVGADGLFALEAPAPLARLAKGSGDYALFEDGGGTWRMGHEYEGGALTPLGHASDHPSETFLEDDGGALATRWDTPSGAITRALRLTPDGLLVTTRGQLEPRHMADLVLRTGKLDEEVTCGVPGGTHTHGHAYLTDPTYYSADAWVRAEEAAGGTLHVLFSGQAAVATEAAGSVRVTALRHARREMAGDKPLLGFPAEAEESEETAFDALVAMDARALAREGARNLAARALPRPMLAAYRPLGRLARAALALEADRAQVIALAPSRTTDGVVLRLLTDEAMPARLAAPEGWRVRPCLADERPLGGAAERWEGRLDGGVHSFLIEPST